MGTDIEGLQKLELRAKSGKLPKSAGQQRLEFPDFWGRAKASYMRCTIFLRYRVGVRKADEQGVFADDHPIGVAQTKR